MATIEATRSSEYKGPERRRRDLGHLAAGIERERRLEEEFRFELPNELTDPEIEYGHVTDVNEVPAISPKGTELPCKVYEVNVWDPFIAADPVTYKAVNDYINKTLEPRLDRDGFDVRNQRSEALVPGQWNKYTRAWLHDSAVRSLAAWRELVPTAQALNHLIHNKEGSELVGRKGKSVPISKETAAQLRFVDDAIGIRDRGAAMSHLLTEHFADAENTDDFQVLSLASGTAEPVIVAAVQAAQKVDKGIDLTVADKDTAAMALVEKNAERHGFKGNITPVATDILADNVKEEISKESGESQFDVVENMGFEEYLPQKGDELGAFRGKNLPQASDFTRRAFGMVKPGGALISGNMVLNRSQLGFVFGVVDWPLINARSEEAILRVYKEAGLVDDPGVKLEMFRVRDAITDTHIYNIVKATKLTD